DKGAEVVFQEVLMVSDETGVKIGRPFVEGATVIGEVVAQTKGPKLLIGKYKKRKGFRKKTGHRQELTSMKIKKISI
ncbi:MAG TPA: 50S ribosomal protein L21, partial [Smithellaceae bacterium]|nr:50S ribosomal protein L21 [Smithellaceae bacterium]